jgi:hypothetical protein
VQSTLVEEGLGYLDQAIELDPEYPDARVFRAITYRDLGRIEEARADLEVVEAGQIPVAMQPFIDDLREDLEAAGATPPSSVPEG